MVPYFPAIGRKSRRGEDSSSSVAEEQATLLVPQAGPHTPLLQREEWRLSLVLSLGRSPRLQIRGSIWQLGICPARGLCPR